MRSLLIAAEGSRYAALFALLVNSGLRRGEALALHWSDIDFDAKLLRVRGTLARVDGELVVTETKTAKSRRATPISPTAEKVLRHLRTRQMAERLRAGSMWQPNPYVFTTELGEPCGSAQCAACSKGCCEAREAAFDGRVAHVAAFCWLGHVVGRRAAQGGL